MSRWRRIGKVHANQCDEFGDDDAERCDGFSETRAGLRPQETGESKSTSRRNRFFTLTEIESDDDDVSNV